MLIVLSASWFPLQAFSLLDLSFQTRAAGMGNAFSGLSDDSSAIFYNPALIYDIPKHQASFGYSSLYASANIFTFSYALPGLNIKALPSYLFPKIGISAGFSTLRDDGVASYSAAPLGNPGDYLKGDTSGYYENLFMLGFGALLKTFSKNELSSGFTLKFFNRKYLAFSSYGYGFDWGMNFKHTFFNISSVLRNVSPGITSGSINEPLPLSVRFGSLIKILNIIKSVQSSIEKRPGVMVFDIPVENLNYTVNPVFDCEITLDDPVAYNFFGGIEGWLNNLVALRIGYNTVNNFTFGGSVQFSKIRLDYTYLMHPVLDETHKITGSFYF